METRRLSFQLLSTFTLKCLDTVNEKRLVQHFLSGVALNNDLDGVFEGELQIETEIYNGDLEVPEWYLTAIGLKVADLEDRDDIIYFQHLWNVEGDFYVTSEGMLRNMETKTEQTLSDDDFWLTFDLTVIGIELLGAELGKDHVLTIY